MSNLIEKAKTIYTYAYPIVWTKQVFKLPKEGFYQPSHVRTLAKADGASYKPNNDTLYSLQALQLASTPYVLEIPKLPDERYLLLNILNIKTEIFFSTGSKEDGNGAGKYILLYKDAEIPSGYENYTPVRSDDSLNMLLIRIESNGESDYEITNAIQDAFVIKPVYQDKLVDVGTPIQGSHKFYVEQLSPEKYIEEFLSVEADTQIDDEIYDALKELGIDVKHFDYSKLSEESKEALEEGFKQAYKDIENYDGKALESNHWKTYVDGVATFGKDYLLRAFVSWFAWGANLPEDSIYPVLYADQDGDVFDSNKDYVIHFEKDGLPRAKFFWSLTLYSEPSGTLVDNELDRYVINSHWIDKLRFNEDGSLDILLSKHKPEKEEDFENWLPTPEKEESFSLLLRMYGADEDTLSGKWEFPVVKKING